MARVLAERHLASGHTAWVAMSEITDGDMAISDLKVREKSASQKKFLTDMERTIIIQREISKYMELTVIQPKVTRMILVSFQI